VTLETYKKPPSFHRGFSLTHDAIFAKLIVGVQLKVKRKETDGILESYKYQLKDSKTEENLSFLTKNLFVRPVSWFVASLVAAFVGGLDKMFGIFDGMKEAVTTGTTAPVPATATEGFFNQVFNRWLGDAKTVK
jgi:hypothetical protein